jgi:hypothetical protein
MGKGACTFKETDVTRAIRAAKKAGVDVRIEIDLERKRMTLTPVKVVEPNKTDESNEWDTD